MSKSLGEKEMLWEHEQVASISTAFLSSPKLSRVFLPLSITLFLLENTRTQERESTCLLESSKCKFSLLAIVILNIIEKFF